MSCDVGKATEWLENELWRRWSDGKVGEWAHSTTFPYFTYVTDHSPTLPSLYLRHSSFSNTSAASPTSQFILQHFFRFCYVTSSSLNSPGERPILPRHDPHTRRKCLRPPPLLSPLFLTQREEYVGNVPISPLGTPFFSVHGSTHYLQMTKLQYVISRTTIELQIKNDSR